MTESQKAFEEHYRNFYDLPDMEFPKFNGSYAQSYQHREYAHWQAAEAYGRKQALEELMHFISTEIVVSGCNVADEIVGVIKDIQDGK